MSLATVIWPAVRTLAGSSRCRDGSAVIATPATVEELAWGDGLVLELELELPHPATSAITETTASAPSKFASRRLGETLMASPSSYYRMDDKAHGDHPTEVARKDTYSSVPGFARPRRARVWDASACRLHVVVSSGRK